MDIEPDNTSGERTPRWVKVLGVAGLVVVVLLAVVLITGGGDGHGPGRHSGATLLNGHTPPAGGHANP